MRISIRLLEDGPEPVWVPYARTKQNISILRTLDPRPEDTTWELCCRNSDFVAVEVLLSVVADQDADTSFEEADHWIKSISNPGGPTIHIQHVIYENMDPREQEVFQTAKYPEQNITFQPAKDNRWTIVTYYSADDPTAVLSLNQNLLIVCSTEIQETVIQVRTRLGLLGKSTFAAFNEPKTKYECMRFAVKLEPFPDSTHYAWLDANTTDLRGLDHALSMYRDKVSMLHLDYVCKQRCQHVLSWPTQYMSSRFFTGRKDYMQDFCERMMDSSLPMVYFDAPEIFELYYGTEDSIFTNYERPQADLHHIIHGLITRSTQDRDYAVARRACDQVASAWIQGHVELTDDLVWPFFKWNFMTAWYQNDRKTVMWILQTLSDLLRQRPKLQTLLQQCASDIYYVTDWALLWLPEKINKEQTYEPEKDYEPEPNTRLFIWQDGPLTSESLIHQNPVIRPLAHRPAHLPA